MALEAMFADSGEFQISDACRKQDLEDMLEQYHENPDDETILQSLGRHPDLAFTLALTMDDHQGLFRNDDRDNNALLDLVAFVVVQISFPQCYPLYDMPPDIQLLDIMVTSHTAPPIRTDKTLESCVHMRHDALHAQMRQECHSCLPELCIYDVVSTWLSEHLFEFAELRTHAVLP